MWFGRRFISRACRLPSKFLEDPFHDCDNHDCYHNANADAEQNQDKDTDGFRQSFEESPDAVHYDANNFAQYLKEPDYDGYIDEARTANSAIAILLRSGFRT